jgi:hypothetical protein
MAGQSFLRLVSGVITEILGIQSSAGAGDAGKIPALDSTGKIDPSMMPVGVAAETKIAVASETLSAGDLVSFWDNSGTINVRKADGSAAGKPAHGFVLAGFSASASATVYLPSQINTQKTGLTPGATYYLDVSTAGAITSTAPSGAGKVSQVVGVALSATELSFVPQYPITLAA